MEDSREDLRTKFRAATEAAKEGRKTEDGGMRNQDGGGRTEEGLAGFGLASVGMLFAHRAESRSAQQWPRSVEFAFVFHVSEQGDNGQRQSGSSAQLLSFKSSSLSSASRQFFGSTVTSEYVVYTYSRNRRFAS